MRASLDTNVIIHFYKAGLQCILFDFFDDGVFIYELPFDLYGTGDLGEVYAISLAQTVGAYSLVTDDIKQGGPYMSLLQFEDDIMPFTFADILILRYLIGAVDETRTIADFNTIDSISELNWSFGAQIKRFIRRFYLDPYRDEDTIWIKELAQIYNINVKHKLTRLANALRR